LSLSYSRLRHHPVAGALQESDGHSFASFVILHADDSCLRRSPFSACLDSHVIVELQRQGRKKNGEFRAAIFHDRGLAKTRFASAFRGYLHGNSNGPCLRKEFCQLLSAASLVRCECQAAGDSHVASRLTGQIHSLSQGETHDSAHETQSSSDRDARWTPKAQRGSVVASCRNCET
jgi:hypothetical protein